MKNRLFEEIFWCGWKVGARCQGGPLIVKSDLKAYRFSRVHITGCSPIQMDQSVADVLRCCRNEREANFRGRAEGYNCWCPIGCPTSYYKSLGLRPILIFRPHLHSKSPVFAATWWCLITSVKQCRWALFHSLIVDNRGHVLRKFWAGLMRFFL